jgi:hypothetical protein
MQFGLFYGVPEDPRHSHAERFAEMLDLIVYGEALGFDVAWLAEIHCSGAFSLLSAPLMVVPAMIACRRHVMSSGCVRLSAGSIRVAGCRSRK